MADKTTRSVKARRMLTIGGLAASLSVPAAVAAAGLDQVEPAHGANTGMLMAQAEGEGEGAAAPAGGEGEGEGEGASAGGEGEGASAGGEGEGASAGEGEGEGEGASAGGEGGGEGEGEGGGDGAPPNVAFLRDLGFMTGHLRAGMALYEEGDVEAAKTHMGHPIEEKYGAVEGELEALGYGTLRDDLMALSAATEEGAPAEEIRSLFDAVIAKADAAGAASPATPRERLMALAALGRIAADEYAVGLEGGQLSNLHEYQDSWGFLRTIETEAGKLAGSGDGAVAGAADQIIVLVEGLGGSYGDLQGENLTEVDPSVLYGAAARMELAALGVE